MTRRLNSSDVILGVLTTFKFVEICTKKKLTKDDRDFMTLKLMGISCGCTYALRHSEGYTADMMTSPGLYITVLSYVITNSLCGEPEDGFKIFKQLVIFAISQQIAYGLLYVYNGTAQEDHWYIGIICYAFTITVGHVICKLKENPTQQLETKKNQ